MRRTCWTAGSKEGGGIFKEAVARTKAIDKEISVSPKPYNQNDDIAKIGTYDIDNDDVILHLCPAGCGGPIIGHIYNDDDECLRKASPDHDPYTEDQSRNMQENIKRLPAWNKAKMIWITDKPKCKCDMCTKTCKTMFHLYDHMKNDHKIPEPMITSKLTDTK